MPAKASERQQGLQFCSLHEPSSLGPSIHKNSNHSIIHANSCISKHTITIYVHCHLSHSDPTNHTTPALTIYSFPWSPVIRFPPSSVLCSFVVPCSVGFSASPHLKHSLCIAVLLQGCYLSISLSQLFVCNLVLLFIKCFDLSCNYIIYLNPALCFLWVHWLFAADLASSQTKLTSSASSALRPEHQGSPYAQTGGGQDSISMHTYVHTFMTIVTQECSKCTISVKTDTCVQVIWYTTGMAEESK